MPKTSKLRCQIFRRFQYQYSREMAKQPASFSIFGDGELESSMEEVQKPIDWKNVIKEQYEEVLEHFSRPIRQEYETSNIPNGVYAERLSIRIEVSDGIHIEGSYWKHPRNSKSSKRPCLIYCHGMDENGGGNLLSVTPNLAISFECGMDCFAYDARGAGKSEGQDVTYGWKEKEDLRMIIQHLKREGTISHVFLWGIGSGASVVIQYLHMVENEAKQQGASKYGFLLSEEVSLGVNFTVKGNFRKKIVVETLIRAEGVVSAANESDIQEGDVLLAIGHKSMVGENMSTMRRVLETSSRPIMVIFSSQRLRQGDPRKIEGVILDSPYESTKQLVQDMIQNLQSDGLAIPSPIVALFRDMFKRAMKNRIGHDMEKVSISELAQSCHAPALFIVADNNMYITPASTMAVYNGYAGAQSLVSCPGGLRDDRPQVVQDAVREFISRRVLELGATQL